MADFTIKKTPLDNGLFEVVEYVGGDTEFSARLRENMCQARTKLPIGPEEVSVRCGLETGHPGNHEASGTDGYGWKFRMQWGEATANG